jgi:hypothetical protein
MEDLFAFPVTEQIGVPIKKYDRFDVAEHVGYARLFWSEGKRCLVIDDTITDDIFEVVLKSNGYNSQGD